MTNSKDSKSDKRQTKKPSEIQLDPAIKKLLERAMNPDKETKRK